MSQSNLKPLVGVVSDVRQIEPHSYHMAGDKYLRALAQAADVIPVIIPSLLSDQAIEQWLTRMDGVFLTGAYSMADPDLYGEPRIDKPYDYDEQRDELSIQIVKTAIQRDIPIFAVCRGLQDINVALEGSLYQAVQEVPGMMDHREDKSAELSVQYGAAHSVSVTPGGLMHSILQETEFEVNSLHSQGINRLGSGLKIEATAPDGLVEAVSITSMHFGLAVQWHPEWEVMNHPNKKRLFQAFGQACRMQQAK
jgi:putative glutamine amidotransferase